MSYEQESTAQAFLETARNPHMDTFLQLEQKTLSDALKALGVDLAAGPLVLDVGCGDGRICKSMNRSGAVCSGCDSSEAMIAAARAAELGAEKPIEYYTADATSNSLLPGAGSYDLVISIYVLHMARNEGELQAMCNFLGRHVRPGGAAVVLTVSGEYQPAARQCKLMRGCWGYTSVRAADGSSGSVGSKDGSGSIGRVEFVMGSGSQEVRVLNYQYPAATYKHCLEHAGFEDVKGWPMRAPEQLLAWAEGVQGQADGSLSGQGGKQAGGSSASVAVADAELAELLLLYLANPHVTGFVARKRV